VCPIWLFEDDVFGSEVEPFKSEIRRQGMRFALIRSESLHPGFPLIVDGHEIQDYDCVLVQAGHQTFRQAVLLDQWLPVGWCTLPHFACSVSYPHFAEFLLNRDYRIGAVAELMSESLPDEVFIRPDSGMKTFTGRRISIATLPHAIPHLPFYPDTKVVIARTRRIDREWRLVIVGDTVLAASQYFVAGQPSLAQGCPNEVRSFAERMLARVRWRPDPIFVMDICEADDTLHLLELNGYSCSGLYHCDPRPIVATVSDMATTLWKSRR